MAQTQTKEKKERFKRVYKQLFGHIAKSCEAAGIGRRTYYTWTTPGSDQYDEEFTEALRDIREGLVDYAETKHWANVRKGKETSIIYTLKTLGASRGWGNKVEADVTVNGSLQVNSDIEEQIKGKTDDELRAFIKQADELLESFGDTSQEGSVGG